MIKDGLKSDSTGVWSRLSFSELRKHEASLRNNICEKVKLHINLNQRNLRRSTGEERPRKLREQQSAPWRTWFIASFSGSFLSISFGLFSLCSLRTGSLLWGLIAAAFTDCLFSPSLSSVPTVFRVSAGSYCLPRLQPNTQPPIFAYLSWLRG